MTSPQKRRKHFKAALALSGWTLKGWAREQGVTAAHLHEVLKETRPSERLNTEIDALIAKYIPQQKKVA